jgi:hypothetical protein
MIEMHLSFIPARGTHDPWEVASATVGGVAYSQRSRSTSIAKLARALVAAAVQDQPWIAVSPNGTVALRGRSLHGIAKTTISESDRGGLERRIWHPRPAGAAKDGSKAPAEGEDTGEKPKADQHENAPANAVSTLP